MPPGMSRADPMSLSRNLLPALGGGLLVTGGLASGAGAGEVRVSVTLPRIDAAPYYRPYLAAWIETPEGDPAATLAVWYDTRLRDNIGTGFLRNLRTWWRATGEEMTLPADGVSGPTRGPGTYDLAFDTETGPLAGLAPGPYRLAVEVAREDGGRDLVRLPLDLTGDASEETGEGADELGRVTLAVEP